MSSRNALRFLLLLAIVVLSGCARLATDSELERLQARAEAVTIIRDDFGVPHIYAKTDADAVFGMLYAQSEDDFNRVERNYIWATGRLAEVDGEQAIYSDLRARLYMTVDEAKALAREIFETSGKRARVFTEFFYAAKTWEWERWIVAKAEHSRLGENPRFVISTLTDFPPEICELTYLNQLRFAGHGYGSVPEEIGHLTELKVLDLSRNNLESIPASIRFLDKLSKLDLSKNEIASLPDEIGDLQGLKTLNLKGNPLVPGEAERIQQLLPETKVKF